jgi:hypothetical protein
MLTDRLLLAQNLYRIETTLENDALSLIAFCTAMFILWHEQENRGSLLVTMVGYWLSFADFILFSKLPLADVLTIIGFDRILQILHEPKIVASFLVCIFVGVRSYLLEQLDQIRSLVTDNAFKEN